MTERLSHHEQKLLIRYRRLLQRWRTAPVHISISDIAEVLYCTPRHARTLLGEMQQSGWLHWSARVGRGAGGVLKCHVDEAALQALLDGEYTAMQTERTHVLPLPVVQEHAEGGEYTLQFFRPLMKVAPSLYTGWPERHLIQTVHAGLMRFLPGGETAVPGLAHTAEVSVDGLSWIFFLRRGLLWHSGEPVKPEQLFTVIRRHVGGPGLPHVAQVTLSGHTLRFKLTKPDVLLPQRLAHPAYALPHPEESTTGLGPFRVSEHTESALVLERSPFWYGETPQTARVKFEIHPEPTPNWSIIKLETTRLQRSIEPVRMITGDGGFTFITFNDARATMTKAQQAVVLRIAQGLLKEMFEKVQTIQNLPDWLNVKENINGEPVELPRQLNMVYCRTSETTAFMRQLKKSLQWRGCQLNITTRAASHWLLPEEDWSSFDLSLGFQPLGANQARMMEEHYRHCAMFRAFWGVERDERNKKFLTSAVKGTENQHARRIMRVFNRLLEEEVIVPIYIQRWQLNIPAEVRGVEACELGWPDFSKIWAL